MYIYEQEARSKKACTVMRVLPSARGVHSEHLVGDQSSKRLGVHFTGGSTRLSHTMYQSNDLRRSTPPPNRQLLLKSTIFGGG